VNPAYRTTVFRLEGAPPNQPFWIVTAFNPEGRRVAEENNRRKDHELLAWLTKRNETPIRVTGLSPDGSHAEPGWTITHSSIAREAGETFDQEALYRIQGGKLFLVDLATGSEENLGPWKTRLTR